MLFNIFVVLTFSSRLGYISQTVMFDERCYFKFKSGSNNYV